MSIASRTGLEEITVTIVEVRQRFENSDAPDTIIAVARVDDAGGHPAKGMITIKGPEDDEFIREVPYRLFGRWSEYRNKWSGKTEEQFHFQSCVYAKPHSREAIILYLARAGEGIGLGRARATNIHDVYGQESIDACKTRPAEVAKFVRGWNEEQAFLLAERLTEQESLEHCSIELLELFNRRGFRKDLASKAVRKWGNRAPAVIARDPFKLLGLGATFLKCDELYLSLGLPKDRLKRQALCAWYAVSSDTNGHTWLPIGQVIDAMRSRVGITPQTQRALIFARRAKLLAFIRTDASGRIAAKGDVWCAEYRNAKNEIICAEQSFALNDATVMVDVEKWETQEVKRQSLIRCTRCERLLTANMVHVLNNLPYGPDCITKIEGGDQSSQVPTNDWLSDTSHTVTVRKKVIVQETRTRPTAWPSVGSLDGISAHQAERLSIAIDGHFGILGGSPGTGKTHTTAALIKAIIAQNGSEAVAVVAPTGKAAVRITETMNKMGIKIGATTIHRFLGLGMSEEEDMPRSDSESTRFVFADETSFDDVRLLAALMGSRKPGSHLLLVGDIHQLPPVGNGAPMRDLIAAGVPYGELREVRRNSGAIVEVCAYIRDGVSWGPHGNCQLLEAYQPDGQIVAMIQQLRDLDEAGIDPVWDAQVIVPVNQKSPLSRHRLNLILQNELNPGEQNGFRVGDKVVNTQNTWMRPDKNHPIGKLAQQNLKGEVYVANGEQGRVIAVEPKRIAVELSVAGAVVWAPLGKPEETEEGTATCRFDLAYAISAHKAQGSEWPIGLVMLDSYPGAMRVASREWIYTAISRAKECCYLIGSMDTAQRMCRVPSINQRKTLLKEQIELIRLMREIDQL